VIIAVKKQPGTSTLKLTKEVDSAISELRETLPQNIELNGNLFKQANFISLAVNNVIEAVRDGALLVCIILFLFLMNFRITLITLTAIPVSIAVTFLIFWQFGFEINTMTLGGIAIAIGLLVDDAIVDVENVFRRLRENLLLDKPRPRLQVIYDASREIRSSIIFATLIVVFAFLPMFFLAGLEGRFFIPLGVSFVISLLASLLVSLSITPVLCSLLLTDQNLKKAHKETLIVRKLKQFNKAILLKLFKHPFLILAPTALAFAIALFMTTKFSSEFLPEFDEGTALLSVILPPGVSLDYSNTVGSQIEKALVPMAGIKNVSRRTGRAELDEHAEGVNVSEIDIDFEKDGSDRKEILNKIREKVEAIAPNAGVNVGQPISHRLDHMLSGVNAQIAIKIYGDERHQLTSIGHQTIEKIKGIDGLVDAFVERQVSIPQVKSYLIREDANLYNINAGKLADSLELALKGVSPSQVIEGNRVTDVFVRLDDESRNSLEAIKKTLIKVMPDGSPVLLKDVADVFESKGPNIINRENMKRRLVVQANVDGRAISDVVKDIKDVLKTQVKLPQQYFVKLEGQFESQKQAANTVLLLSIFSLIAVLLLLYSYFKSYTLSLQVLLNIPLAFIGAVFALSLTGGVVSLASLVAFVTLCGIASRNGILMLSHYLHLMRFEGENFTDQMIIRGSLERLVPVLMTAFSAIFALVPLVLASGQPGKEILHPVAVVVVGGLLSSTILDIWVTPVVFRLIGKRSSNRAIKRLEDKESTL